MPRSAFAFCIKYRLLSLPVSIKWLVLPPSQSLILFGPFRLPRPAKVRSHYGFPITLSSHHAVR